MPPMNCLSEANDATCLSCLLLPACCASLNALPPTAPELLLQKGHCFSLQLPCAQKAKARMGEKSKTALRFLPEVRTKMTWTKPCSSYSKTIPVWVVSQEEAQENRMRSMHNYMSTSVWIFVLIFNRNLENKQTKSYLSHYVLKDLHFTVIW